MSKSSSFAVVFMYLIQPACASTEQIFFVPLEANS